MPSLKLADAVIYYQPHDHAHRGSEPPGSLMVGRSDADLDKRFGMSWPATMMCRSSDEHAQLAGLMLLFRYLTVEYGVDPKLVDAEFQKIKEYAAALKGGD